MKQIKSIEEVEQFTGIKPAYIGSIYADVSIEAARGLIANKAPNRNIRPQVIRQYAAAMTDGSWEQNAATAPIMIDDKGKLIGGQHRMLAQISAGIKTMMHPVIFGASDKQGQLQDTGANRSFGDKVQHIMNHTWMPDIPYLYPKTIIAAMKILQTSKLFCENASAKGMATQDPMIISKMITEKETTLKKISDLFAEDASTPLYTVSAFVAAFVDVAENQTNETVKKFSEILKRSNHCDTDRFMNSLYQIYQARHMGGSSPRKQFELFQKVSNCLWALIETPEELPRMV